MMSAAEMKKMSDKLFERISVLAFLFDLILYVPVNNISVLSGQVFLC